MIIASLPFTPLLILGFSKALNSFKKQRSVSTLETSYSLNDFAFCWLLAVFLLFTFAATKLPSYWLPATPAAAILIGLVESHMWRAKRNPYIYNRK